MYHSLVYDPLTHAYDYRPIGLPRSGGGSTKCCSPSVQNIPIVEFGLMAAPKFGADIVFYELNLPAGGSVFPVHPSTLKYKLEMYIINEGADAVGILPPLLSHINGHPAGSEWIILPAKHGVLLRKMSSVSYAGVQGLLTLAP